MKGGKIKMNLFSILGVCWILGGVVYYIFSSNFRKKAIRTTATITEIQMYRNSEGVEHCNVDVEFEVDGKVYGGRLGSFSSARGMWKGGKIEIDYNPDNPNKFKSIGSDRTTIICILVGIFWLVLNYFIFIKSK